MPSEAAVRGLAPLPPRVPYAMAVGGRAGERCGSRGPTVGRTGRCCCSRTDSWRALPPRLPGIPRPPPLWVRSSAAPAGWWDRHTHSRRGPLSVAALCGRRHKHAQRRRQPDRAAPLPSCGLAIESLCKHVHSVHSTRCIQHPRRPSPTWPLQCPGRSSARATVLPQAHTHRHTLRLAPAVAWASTMDATAVPVGGGVSLTRATAENLAMGKVDAIVVQARGCLCARLVLLSPEPRALGRWRWAAAPAPRGLGVIAARCGGVVADAVE
jgi:hypothetical protein